MQRIGFEEVNFHANHEASMLMLAKAMQISYAHVGQLQVMTGTVLYVWIPVLKCLTPQVLAVHE